MNYLLLFATILSVVHIAHADDVNEGPYVTGSGLVYYNQGVSKSPYSYDTSKTYPCGNATVGTKCGPKSWFNITTFGVTNKCAGKMQSPINIVSNAVVVDATLTYPVMDAGVGCTNYVQLTTDHAFNFGVSANYPAAASTPCTNPPKLTYGALTYNLLQGVIHTKSEHSVDGTFFDGELHLMHKAANGSVLVVAMVLDASSPTEHPVLASFWSQSYSKYKAAGGTFPKPSNITLNDFAKAASYQYKVRPDLLLPTSSCTHPLALGLPPFIHHH